MVLHGFFFEKFFEQENNIYRKEYYLQKERVDKDTINAFEIATQTVEKTYPPKDVAQLMVFKTNYRDLSEARHQCQLLSDLIDQIGR